MSLLDDRWNELEALIEASRVSRDTADVIRREARPSLRLIADDDDTLVSFGGQPRVPRSFEWPMSSRGPLSFLADIDLDAIGARKPSWLTEVTGSLLVFVWYLHPNEFFSARSDLWHPLGLDADERELWRIVHVEPHKRVPASTPTGAYELKRGRFSGVDDIGISVESVAGAPDHERQACRRVAVEFALSASGARHRLFGAQDDNRPMFELSTVLESGVGWNAYVESQKAYHDSPAAAVEPTPHEMLIQIGTDPACDIWWLSDGMVCLCVPSRDGRGIVSDAWLSWWP
jgi:hypothetical protein